MSGRKQRISFQSGPRISESLLLGRKTNKQTNKQRLKTKKNRCPEQKYLVKLVFIVIFFCLFARSSLNARVFQLSTNDEKSDLFCSESFSIENTETMAS